MLNSYVRRVRIERPARVVTTTMEIADPENPREVLFRATVSIEVDDLPPGISIDGVRFDWTDRRRPRAEARPEGAPS